MWWKLLTWSAALPVVPSSHLSVPCTTHWGEAESGPHLFSKALSGCVAGNSVQVTGISQHHPLSQLKPDLTLAAPTPF